MSFFNQLFGTIAGFSGIERLSAAGISSIPINATGKTLKIKGSGAKWLGMRNKLVQKHAYEFCYPVSSVIDRLAEYDITGKVEILRSTGKGKNNFATNEWAQRMNALLEQPNGMQSWEQFRGQQMVYKKTFGFCPVLPIMPTGFESQPWMAVALVNIPPWLFEAVPTREIITNAIRKEDVVKEYRATILGKTVTFTPSQLFILEDGFMQDEATDFILPLSKLVGLDMAISNVCAAMEADNVLLKKKGPLGFISHDAATKDQASYTPMSKMHKTQLQRALSNYGLSWDQYQYVISRVATKWNPMSFNVRDLGTKETIQACEKAICHRFAFPYVLYEETDTTYANGDNASATVYQTNVIPNNTKDLNKYNKFFKARENVCNIVGNFEDVGALQEDKKFEAEVKQTNNATYKEQYDNNLITLNRWRELMDEEKIEGGDVLKSATTIGDISLAGRIGIEGVNAISSIMSNTGMDEEQKKNALIILFGIDSNDANKLVTKKEVEEDTDPEFSEEGIPKLNIAI